MDFFSLPPFVSRSSTHFSQLISQIVQKRPKSWFRTEHQQVYNPRDIIWNDSVLIEPNQRKKFKLASFIYAYTHMHTHKCKHGIMAYHLPHAYRHTICYMQTCNLYTYLAHTSTHTPTCEANHLTVREPCHELDGGIFLHIAQRANMLWARFQLLCSAVCVCGREHARRTRKRPPRERVYA